MEPKAENKSEWADAAAQVDGVTLEGEVTREELNISGGDQYPAEQGSDVLAGAISTALVITFGLVASRKGDHWKLQEAEALEAGRAYAALLHKYFPDIGGGVEVTAIMCTAALIGPRMMIDKARAAEEEAKASGDKSQ